MSEKCVFFFSITLNVCYSVINVEFASIKHFNDDDFNKMSTVSYAHKLYIILISRIYYNSIVNHLIKYNKIWIYLLVIRLHIEA